MAGADVVVANLPPRTLASLGLDYESLRAIRPDIILTASTAFGTDPRVSDRVAFDGIGQALSGSVHTAGTPDQPIKAMVPFVDFGTALACALGTVLALYERKQSGLGQEVSASLLRTALNFSSGTLIEEALLKLDRPATLNRAPNYAPSDIFKVKDGWIIAQVIGQAMFKRWCRLVGRPELFDDPTLGDDLARGRRGEFISGIMSQWCAGLTRQEALGRLEAERIPASAVNSPRETLEDEVVQAAQAIEWIDYPGAPGPVPIMAPPVALSRTPPEIRKRPPQVGEHTDQILMEIGYSSEQIAGLRQRHVI